MDGEMNVHRVKRSTATWLLLTGFLVLEFLLLDTLTSRHHAWVYPRWNDQIQYLTEAYTAFLSVDSKGHWTALWGTLVNPSAQGTLHDTVALLVFAVTGPSRSAALAVNWLTWIGLQACIFATARSFWKSSSAGWIALAMLLMWWTPVSGAPGSATDFRLDFPTACMMGLTLAAAIGTHAFEKRGAALLFGVCVGLTLLTRFLTGTYLALVFVLLSGWLLFHPRRGARILNLVLAGLVATALALPILVLNREWVWNYYVVGHFIGPESAIRNPNMGLASSLHFVSNSLLQGHLGLVAGAALVLGLCTLPLTRVFTREPRKQPLTVEPRADRWFGPALAFVLGPAIVLVLHQQKSSVVQSIMAPGVLFLSAGVWIMAVLRFNGARSETRLFRMRHFAAGVFLACGCVTLLLRTWPSPHSPEFIRDARKVNAMADWIHGASHQSKLSQPTIAVDRITDSLDGQIMRVIVFERQHVWIPFVMTLPTGIMRDEPDRLLDRLKSSDFVFLADDHAGGTYPFDQQMLELAPLTRSFAERNLTYVETFPLFGRTFSLYRKPASVDAEQE